MMQAASDIFLGWASDLRANRHYYWRQLRDMKGSVEVEGMGPATLNSYAGICGWTLARAHARSGDPVAIAAYLGEDDEFDRSIGDFAERYAEQNERDYQAFAEAIRSGRLQALEGL
jgi:sugar/nucleoside kinase (ribokinase family)